MDSSVMRYTQEQADAIIKRLMPHTVGDLDGLYADAVVPAFEEVQGRTAGAWLAKAPKNYWWSNAFIKVFLNSPWARWSGKGFFTPFGQMESGDWGRGANLFRNRFRPIRYKLDTFVKKAEADDNPCLTLRYPFGSVMYGLIDDVRKIENGVLLGQMHFKFFWRKDRVFIGYFVLCVLEEPV